MEHTPALKEPVPIPKMGGRYLLFDINVATHLRRNHHIMGVLTGSIPLVPQQNIFMGLPIELLPEEVRFLVLKGVGYIVDDLAFHKQCFSSFEGADRKIYLQSLRSESLKAQKLAQGKSAASTARWLAKQAASRAARQSSSTFSARVPSSTSDSTNTADQDSLFSGDRPASSASSKNSSLSSASRRFAITPSATYPPLTAPLASADLLLPEVPVSFPLFAYLYERGYYMSPGLRFGCDYTVYPGDPLRFHAHFLGVGYDWDEEIPLVDIVGGGRLGTGVKKGYLFGGSDTSKLLKSDGREDQNVRTFCIEWGGM